MLKYERKFSQNNKIKPSKEEINKSIKSLNPKIKKAIDFAYSRILKFRQGTLTSLYTTHDNTVSGAVFDDSALKYVRITNLGVEDLQIVVIAENTLEFAYEIKPNQSFYLYSHQLVVEADDSDAITTAELATLEDIDEVKAHCQKGNAKVEIFAASTDHLAV